MTTTKKNYHPEYGTDLIKYLKFHINTDNDHPDKFIINQILRPTESMRDESGIVPKRNLMDDVNLMVNLTKDNKIDKEMAKQIFYTKNFQHIKALCYEYKKRLDSTTSIGGGSSTNCSCKIQGISSSRCGDRRCHSMQNLIEKTFVHNKFMLLNIVTYAINPVSYFSDVLRRSMKGLGTNSKLLSATIILRCEIDMLDIKVEFQKFNGDTLRNWIRDDTSGYYKYALYELINEKRGQRRQQHQQQRYQIEGGADGKERK